MRIEFSMNAVNILYITSSKTQSARFLSTIEYRCTVFRVSSICKFWTRNSSIYWEILSVLFWNFRRMIPRHLFIPNSKHNVVRFTWPFIFIWIMSWNALFSSKLLVMTMPNGLTPPYAVTRTFQWTIHRIAPKLFDDDTTSYFFVRMLLLHTFLSSDVRLGSDWVKQRILPHSCHRGGHSVSCGSGLSVCLSPRALQASKGPAHVRLRGVGVHERTNTVTWRTQRTTLARFSVEWLQPSCITAGFACGIVQVRLEKRISQFTSPIALLHASGRLWCEKHRICVSPNLAFSRTLWMSDVSLKCRSQNNSISHWEVFVRREVKGNRVQLVL